MKIFWRSAAGVLAMLALGFSNVQGADEAKPAGKPGAKRGEGGKGGPGREAFMKKFDKNGDGSLDDGEKAAAKEAMEKLRGAGGGKPGEGRKFDPERMKQVIAKFDKDGDGKLSDGEREAARAEFMKNGGKPGAGRPEGGKPGAGKPGEGKPGEGRGAEMMKRFDKNGDGKLDDGEKAAAKEAMEKFRANGGKPGEKPKE